MQEVTGLTQDNADLTRAKNKLTQDITGLTTTNKNLKQIITGLTTTNNELTQDQQQLQQQLETERMIRKNLELELDQLKLGNYY